MDLDFLVNWKIGGTAALSWAIALGVMVGSLLVLYIAKKLVVGRLHALANRTGTEIDDVLADLINRTHFLFFLAVSLFLASRVVSLPSAVETPIRTAAVVALFVQVALWGNGLIAYWIGRYRAQTEDPSMATTVGVLGFVSRLLLWTAVLLMLLQNLGFKIDTLITGLGIGGIAVALAVQNILGDLFASLSIVLDKPFLVGDFITIDTLSGTVEHVGLKTTRIRSLTGEQLVFANSDLLNSRIRNFKRMQERRAVFTVGVTYDTPPAKLEQIPQILREVVEHQADVRFDRAHFKELGAFSLNFEVVYWITTPDYMRYMDIQQAVNFELFRRFAQEGLDFAFPSQTLYVQTTGGAPASEQKQA